MLNISEKHFLVNDFEIINAIKIEIIPLKEPNGIEDIISCKNNFYNVWAYIL